MHILKTPTLGNFHHQNYREHAIEKGRRVALVLFLFNCSCFSACLNTKNIRFQFYPEGSTNDIPENYSKFFNYLLTAFNGFDFLTLTRFYFINVMWDFSTIKSSYIVGARRTFEVVYKRVQFLQKKNILTLSFITFFLFPRFAL